MRTLRVRQRTLRGGYVHGLRHEWDEYQVVEGRKILARLGTALEAARWAREYLITKEQGK